MASEQSSAAPVLPPAGEYRYELRRNGELIALEEETLACGALRGARRTLDGLNRHEVDARLDSQGLISEVTLRYRRGPFSRSASYQTTDDQIRGQLSAVAGRESVSAKLGRMREVDADLVLCKALIIARVRARGQARWIGRVAAIDPATLMVASYKQVYHRRDEAGRRWIFEPRMGDADEIEIDDAGRVVRRRARDGVETVLVSFIPERAG